MTPALRYVVLFHGGVTPAHFDLMFETAVDSPLSTWRAPEWPPGQGTLLTPLPDHRPAYLSYEGELSKSRGWVRRVASGTHRVRDDTPTRLVTELEDGTMLHLFRSTPSAAQVLPARS